jgi:hypothetical protein
MRKKTIIMIFFAVLWLAMEAGALVAQEHFLTLTGSVTGIRGGLRKWLEVKSATDGGAVNFRIGKNTVYVPRRYPNIGEKVRVTYIIERGVHIATKVLIFGNEKGEEKKGPPETGNKDEEED